MKGTPARGQAKHDFWERHVREWKRSGLSQAGYCRQHLISLKCFVYWKRKLIAAERSTSLVEAPRFKAAQVLSHLKPLCLRIGHRYSIEIERGFDPETLDQVLRVVEER
jgi:hypothetical protein